MSWIKKTGLFAAILFFLTSGIAGWYYHKTLNQPLQFDSDIFLVERGETLNSIANRLLKEKIISEIYTLKIHARLRDMSTEIKAGEYRFPDGISQAEFFDWLVTGKGQLGNGVTIVEGWTFKQMRQAINNAPKLRHTTRDWTDDDIMAAVGHPELHPEGQFFPDTYYYRRDDSDMKIYHAAFDLMQKKLNKVWNDRKSNLEIKTKYEALIMASIIEKETQVRAEQGNISGVFNNRLRKGMRLQTDPTVIYGIGDEYDGDITRKHLKTDTPYNTYTRHGLPPTPICLPGYDSLIAAANPSRTNFLYFVAMGEGRHKFSKTLKEHNAAVNKYILNK